MVDMAVDAAIGQQAHQMDRTVPLLCPADGPQQNRVFKKIAVPDGFCDAGQLLIDHPACADVGVAHLAVAHLSLRQTHRQAGAFQQGMGAACKQPVQNRRPRRGDRVVRAGGRFAPAVQDHQDQRFMLHSDSPPR